MVLAASCGAVREESIHGMPCILLCPCLFAGRGGHISTSSERA